MNKDILKFEHKKFTRLNTFNKSKQHETKIPQH